MSNRIDLQQFDDFAKRMGKPINFCIEGKCIGSFEGVVLELRRMYAVEDGLREVLRKTKTCSLDSSVRELVNQALAERGS